MRKTTRITLETIKEISDELGHIAIDTEIPKKELTTILLGYAIGKYKKDPTILTKAYTEKISIEKP